MIKRKLYTKEYYETYMKQKGISLSDLVYFGFISPKMIFGDREYDNMYRMELLIKSGVSINVLEDVFSRVSIYRWTV